MTITLEDMLQQHPVDFISDIEINMFMDGSRHSRYGKVKRLIKQGKLIHLRRGLYLITDKLGHTPPHRFALAQQIYPPCYISFESALSYHQLIPERVQTITCAAARRSKEFKTSLGLFNYLHLPPENLYVEVELIALDKHRFFMAKPWKALCDYVYCNKQGWKSISELLESLRIEKNTLPLIKFDEIEILRTYYQSKKLGRFLNNIQRELTT